MAAKKKAAAKKAPKKPRAGRKEVRENPGAGHNLATLGEKAVPAVERYLALQASMESDMAGYKAEFAKLYEEEAGNLGIKQAVLQKELKRIGANKKAKDREKEMKKDEREQTELFRACFAGTPFAEFAEGDLAEPENDDAIIDPDANNGVEPDFEE